MHVCFRRVAEFNPKHDHCSLSDELINFLPLHEPKSFPFAAEERLEVGVRVGVDIVLLEDSEPCVLDDGVAEGGDLELMRPLVEMLVSVDPGEEARDVAQLREGNHCLIELDLAARDELALEDPVVDLLVQRALCLRQGRGRLVPLEDHVEVGHQLAVQTIDRVADVVVALVYPHQHVVVVRRKVVTDEATYVVWVLSESEALRDLLKVVDIGEGP